MGIVTCSHGLIIAEQCDLCTREAAHGRPRLLVSTVDVPSTELHHEAVQVQSRPRMLSAQTQLVIRQALSQYARLSMDETTPARVAAARKEMDEIL